MFIVKRYASDKSRENQIEEALFHFLYPDRTSVEPIHTSKSQINIQEKDSLAEKPVKQLLKPKPP